MVLPLVPVRSPPVQEVDGLLGGGATVKGGTTGKVWSKAKFVNGMAALLAMVNINIPVPITAGGPIGPSELGEKAMVKVGAGTVTVRLIAAAVALGAWLLLRVTAGLVRDPGVAAVT